MTAPGTLEERVAHLEALLGIADCADHDDATDACRHETTEISVIELAERWGMTEVAMRQKLRRLRAVVGHCGLEKTRVGFLRADQLVEVEALAQVLDEIGVLPKVRAAMIARRTRRKELDRDLGIGGASDAD